MYITQAHNGMRVKPAYSDAAMNSYRRGLVGGNLMPRHCSVGIIKNARHTSADRYPGRYGNIMQVQWDDAHDSIWWYDASLIEPAATGEF